MKILIYGAGVIGSVLAGKLIKSGNEVTVLARGKRLQELREKGIVLIHSNTNKREEYSVSLIEELKREMKFDYIIAAMDNSKLREILPILSKNETKNIVLMANTCGGYDEWVKYIGADRLMIGFPCAGGGKENGEITYFIGRGFVRMFQTTTIGEYNKNRSERTDKLIKAFCKAEIPTVYCRDMDAWQKTHVAVILSIAYSIYRYNGDNYKLAHSYNSVKELVQAMKEGFEVIEKSGMKVTPGKLFLLKLPVPILTRACQLYMNTKLAEVGMAKHSMAAKGENIALMNEFHDLIKKSKVNTPVINKISKNLSYTRSEK